MSQRFLVDTPTGSIQCAHVQQTPVHRVGYRPDPWVWTAWKYAGVDGRFHGRWDDPNGTWRTLYAGSSALACYLEVLARFRPDPLLGSEMAQIVDNDDEGDRYPTAPTGCLSPGWCEPRLLASGRLSGLFAVPGHQQSLPTLRGRFLGLARSLGLADLDGAAIRDSKPRALTQAISSWMYTLRARDEQALNGIQFHSRHGDELTPWAVYEREQAEPAPPEIEPATFRPVCVADPDLCEAMRLHHISWTE